MNTLHAGTAHIHDDLVIEELIDDLAELSAGSCMCEVTLLTGASLADRRVAA